MKGNYALGLIIRYLALIVVAVPNLYLFYLVFTPLTVYPVTWILQLVADATPFPGNVILVNGIFARIVPACVAGAAYYLLLILNFTTPLTTKTRIKSLIFLWTTFLILNIARIIVFALLFSAGFPYFDLTHTASWYFGSTVLVLLLWFANVSLFKIKAIPLFSDLKTLFSDIRSKNS